MSKHYKKIPLKRYQQAKPDTFNKNMESSLAEFNGNLNGNNMPVDAIVNDNFLNPTIPESDFSGGGVVRKSSRVPSQAYYYSQKFGWDTGDVWTPELSIDLKSDNWGRGWNRLDAYGQFDDFPLQFKAKEGMLVGCAVIDWHHGINRVSSQQGGQLYVGGDWSTQWGVFVNGVEAARSGTIYPRRHTTQIPFSMPCGSQPVTIDIRFIAKTTLDNSSQFLGDPTTLLDIFGAEIYTRNVIR